MKIKVGQIYRHYKGGEYEILGEGIHSETLEKMVIYKTLYKTEKFPRGTVWIRPVTMWFKEVEWQGKKVKRFELR